MVKANVKLSKKTMIPRIVKATVFGSITFLVFYYIPLMILSTDMIPIDFGTTIFDFTLISVFFVVVGQLLSGTLLGCGFGIARAFVIITYFFTVAGGGIISTMVPVTEVTIRLTVDISIILLMIVSVNMFDIVKNLLEAINILTKKTTPINFT